MISYADPRNIQKEDDLLPIASSFGDHFVWIDGINQSRDLTFSEAYKDLMAQAMSEREGQALEMFIQELRNQYEIRL